MKSRRRGTFSICSPINVNSSSVVDVGRAADHGAAAAAGALVDGEGDVLVAQVGYGGGAEGQFDKALGSVFCYV